MAFGLDSVYTAPHTRDMTTTEPRIFIGTIVEVAENGTTFTLRVTDPTYDFRGPWAGVAGVVLDGEFEGEELSASYASIVRVVE